MKVLYILFFLFIWHSLSAQNFNGQWKGDFVDNSLNVLGLGNDKIDYVLELEVQGPEVTGYSYTYFNERGKRYYTICKLKGAVNRANKEITITEFERTKYNTPPEFRNCFQTHRLRYSKDADDVESLEGNWFPAPNQEGGCGYGHTTLTRRVIKKIVFNNPKPSNTPLIKNNSPFKDMNREPKKPIVIKPGTATKKPSTNSITKNSDIKNQNKKPANTTQTFTLKKDTSVRDDIPVTNLPFKKQELSIVPKDKFEKRSNTLLKTIDIQQETFTVDLYDNGEIDGDSVSVFYNGKLLLSHQRLSDKPITLTLTPDPNRTINELVMYAENLGEIPPNTALMVITDGDKRYEARITSDTEKNGTVMFRHKSR